MGTEGVELAPLGDQGRQEYWETRLRSNFSLGGVGYLGLGEAFNRWSYRVRRHGLTKILKTLHLSPDASVLDMGSGTGFMIEVWRRAGFRNVQGCDLTLVAVERLRDRFPGQRFLTVDISAPEATYSNEFDVVSANDVLFHITDDGAYRQALANISRALRPGGYFIFSENFLRERTLRSDHQVSRSLEEITSVLQQVGLTPVVRRPLFVLMNSPVDSSSPLLALWWRNLTRVLRGGKVGGLLGALLYGPELLFVRLVKDGPSSEVMVCRRAG
jgi:SAM-dependent methyltransferase